ncbi:MAG: hypothetical protein H6811_00945 [Phycisphaeraceae bacterium]|nr:hypothetical protein [Phycisphaeraceae bacterium]
MHGRLLRVALAAVTAALLAPGALAQSMHVGWKWRADQELVYRSTSEMRQSASGGAGYEAHWTHEFVHTDRIARVSSEGDVTIERTYDSLKMNVEHSVLGNVRYDSTKPDRGANAEAKDHALVRPFAAFVGKVVTIEIDAEGHVKSVRGLREILRDAGSGVSGDFMEAAMAGFATVNEDSFRQQIEQSMRLVPGREVRRGESWDVEIDQPLPAVGTIRTTNTCTMRGATNVRGKRCASIELSSKAELRGGGISDALGLTLRDSKGAGEMMFDTELGAIRQWNQRLDWTFTIQSDLLGSAEQRLEQDAKMELIEVR